MNLPHVVLKNIGTGDEVGDVVDASTFRNFKALLDHGFIRAATAQEVAAWETSHAAPASAGSAVSSGDVELDDLAELLSNRVLAECGAREQSHCHARPRDQRKAGFGQMRE